jgi:hypothetical protein
MDDTNDDKPLHHWGDIGFIVLMGGVGLFTLVLIVALMLGYHPYAALFPPSRGPAQSSAAEASATPDSTHEVTVGISPKKPK